MIEQRGTSHVAHYLDDFVTVGTPNTDQCYINQQIICRTCQELGIPLVPHKTVGPSTCLVFLGIEIDTMAMEPPPTRKITQATRAVTGMAI